MPWADAASMYRSCRLRCGGPACDLVFRHPGTRDRVARNRDRCRKSVFYTVPRGPCLRVFRLLLVALGTNARHEVLENQAGAANRRAAHYVAPHAAAIHLGDSLGRPVRSWLPVGADRCGRPHVARPDLGDTSARRRISALRDQVVRSNSTAPINAMASAGPPALSAGVISNTIPRWPAAWFNR